MSFKKSPPLWSSGILLICEKCGKKLDDGENPTLAFRDRAKDAMKKEGVWGKSRVIVTSCLGTCPSGEITVVDVSTHDRAPSHYTLKVKELDAFFERWLSERT